MKEELQGKLVEILTSIQTAAGKASDFAMEQLPDVAQSYVAYGRALSIATMVCPAALLVVAFFLFRICVRENRKNYSDQNDGALIGGGFGGVIATCLASIVFSANLNGALLVWFAPKVWLLKEIAGLLK